MSASKIVVLSYKPPQQSTQDGICAETDTLVTSIEPSQNDVPSEVKEDHIHAEETEDPAQIEAEKDTIPSEPKQNNTPSEPEQSIAPFEPEESVAENHNQGQATFDLLQPSFEDIEDLDRYEPGGYHPALLGDTYDNGRYRIVHKLGHGGSSTVWLARDHLSQRYVALKILCSEATDGFNDIKILKYLEDKNTSHPGRQYISSIYDQFRIEGPNGSHICLVSEVLGPSLKDLMSVGKQLRGTAARKIGRQFVQAVAYLHSEGVCHGGTSSVPQEKYIRSSNFSTDLTAANVAFGVHNFDSWSEDELYSHLGKPETEAIRTASGNPVSDHAPSYVVEPLSFIKSDPTRLQDSIRLIDFGISFFVHDPPEFLGTPPSFVAPETWFEMAADQKTDLWALGCTLYTLRSGLTLVQLYWGGTPLEAVGEIATFLGPLPERWDRLYFDEEGMPQPRENYTGPQEPPRWTDDAHEQPQNLHAVAAYIKDEYHGPTRREDNNVEREKLPIELEIEAEGGRLIYPPEKPTQKMSPEEANSFADLLGKVLSWEPGERTSAHDLISHPWFEGGFLDALAAEDAPPLFQS
ncbi:MAG: hypothetical protein Q9195_009655 [Heterodermia aff. obscurata]